MKMTTTGGSPTTFAQYLAPELPADLRVHDVPMVDATDETLDGLGAIVTDPQHHPIEIVPWPVAGWRALDPGTGIEGGTTTGTFEVWWEGDMLFGHNHAVGGHYLLGWSTFPSDAVQGEPPSAVPPRVLVGTRTTTPTAASCSSRSTASRSSRSWHRRATTSSLPTSSPCASIAAAASTSGPACGTTRCSRWRPRRVPRRARTRARTCERQHRASSVCCSRFPSGEHRYSAARRDLASSISRACCRARRAGRRSPISAPT